MLPDHDGVRVAIKPEDGERMHGVQPEHVF